MADLEPVFYRIGIYGVAVVLCGDVDSASFQVMDRVIASTVAELKFECLSPESTTY